MILCIPISPYYSKIKNKVKIYLPVSTFVHLCVSIKSIDEGLRRILYLGRGLYVQQSIDNMMIKSIDIDNHFFDQTQHYSQFADKIETLQVTSPDIMFKGLICLSIRL